MRLEEIRRFFSIEIMNDGNTIIKDENYNS